ncbi:class I fructose-bisphosphate aldolase [Caldinitratiruptor microaerophilus]|uniref:Fructose-bisphosphate aldolase n=1 Tax=Caldinitratiruptor microaerophilus TaxID=671077 RepID=A0AA35CJB9_9FIRM|nr:2-amino-3,7-dideoxy-D-threo-hept-6-ulosonate synthase [Caldinitratiruptor microaerophilus]BDG60157.1 fructose-bisphosphate aldolase [Caldinitratiruptor microaerophilus]
MFLGKEIRLRRLLNRKSGRLLAITIDHPITRGVLPGLVNVRETLPKLVAGKPDAITMHKGIAEKVFAPFAGEVALILKTSAYSVAYHPHYDAPVADVEEAVRLGADAVSVGMIVGGPEQAQQLTHLGMISKECALYGMPLIAHIYPKGSMIKNPYDADAMAYAVRAGAELGVDIIKTMWTGSAESFAKVIEACPAKVALAGGDAGEKLEDYLRMTREALDIGLAGVTYGRFVWQHEYPAAVIRALAALMHDNASVEEAMEVYEEAAARIREAR